MSIVEKPLRNSNNSCIVCRHSNDVEYWDSGRYLDTPYPLPQEGRIYVCRDCIRDAANQFGFLSPEDKQVLVDRNAYLEDANKQHERNISLVKTIEEAQAVIAAGYPGLAANAPEVVQESIPDVEKVEDAEIIDTLVSEDEEVVHDSTGTPRKRRKTKKSA